MAARSLLAQPFVFFSALYFWHCTAANTQIYRETRQRQCSKPISSVISLLWALHTKGNIRQYPRDSLYFPEPSSWTHWHSQVSRLLMAHSVCVCVWQSVCERERERERERGPDRGHKKQKWRREKLEPATNSIEGEKSQFSFSAEGRLQQLANSVAALNILPLSWTYGKGIRALQTKIKTSLARRADGCKRDSKWL